MLQRIRTSHYISWTSFVYSLAILSIVLFGGSYIRLLLANADSGISSGRGLNGQALAQQITKLALTDAQTLQANGMYASNHGLFIYTLIDTDENIGLTNWVFQQLSPFADEINGLPAAEQVHWYTVNAQTGTQAAIIVSFNRISDLTYYEIAQAPNGLIVEFPIDIAVDSSVETNENELVEDVIIEDVIIEDAIIEDAIIEDAIIEDAIIEDVIIEDVIVERETAVAEIATNETQVVTGIVVEAEAQPDFVTSGQQVTLVDFRSQGVDFVASGIDPAAARIIVDDFENGSENWLLLAGEWVAADGVYGQKNVENFDQISILNQAPINQYLAEISFYLNESQMGPGFVYQMPDNDRRSNALIADLADNGSVLRLGAYNENGDYALFAAYQLETPLELGVWYTFSIFVTETETVLFLDGVEIGRYEGENRRGYLGLVTSRAAVDFDNFRLILFD